VINFILIALAMFIVIKIINRIKREVEDAMDDPTKTTIQEATPSKPPVELCQEKLLEEIRDLLKASP
jgi:large-conductance mechanosensitive channel